ncbi:MAG: helix-hairpin-helix domain-containing protein [Promethearchaeota archaeon]
MTDVSENVLEKKLDLKTYYKLAQDAFEAKNLSQAKQISENGLRQAQLENNGEWTQKFDSFNTELAQFSMDRVKERDILFANQESIIKPELVSVKEDLTIIKGIGKSVVEKLYQAGINSVKELASTSKERLMRIKGIGSETAMRFIDAAKSSIKVPTLNTFTGSNPITKPSVQENLIEEESNPEESSNKDEQWFNDKFKRLKSGIWYSPQIQEVSESKVLPPSPQVPPLIKDDEPYEVEDLPDYEQIPEDAIIEKNNFQEENLIKNKHLLPSTIENLPHIETEIHNEIIEEKKVNTYDTEKLTSVEINYIKTEIQEEFTSNGYYLINHNPFLKNIFNKIDLLGVKIVQVNEFLDLLLLVPVKINSIKGSLIISEDSVDYNFSHETGKRYNRTTTTVLNVNLDKITQSQEIIFNELISEGTLFQFFRKYLKLNISVEKTITNKKLFFRVGALQYKVLIEPVIINHGNVGLIEKVIPFAYQKYRNLHILELENLSELLPYLEKKYYLIEAQNDQETSIKRYFKATGSLMEELRLYSIPFIGFGVIFAFALLSQVPELIEVFMNLGFGLIIIYGVVVGYLYYKFYKKKVVIQQEFHTPYYQKLLELDETSLILINEEFSPELMAQFSYECLGKNVPFPLISQLERNRAEDLLTKKKITSEIEKGEFFESKLKGSDSKMKDKLISKYGSFLED